MPDADLKQLAEWIAEQLGDWHAERLDIESKYNHALTHTENDIAMKLWVSIEGGAIARLGRFDGNVQLSLAQRTLPSNLVQSDQNAAADGERHRTTHTA